MTAARELQFFNLSPFEWDYKGVSRPCFFSVLQYLREEMEEA